MLRSVVALVFLAVSIAVLSPVALLLGTLAGHPRPMHRLARWIMSNTLRLAGVRVEVAGLEKLGADPKNTLIVANHASHLDPPAVYVGLGVDIQALAKNDVFRVPLMGAVLRRAGCVPIERGDKRRSSAAIDALAAALEGGGTVMVFPEGTRSPDGSLQPFKRGVFVAAIAAGSRVVPVALEGTYALLPRHRRSIRPGTVKITVLDPVAAQDYSYDQREGLADLVRGRIAAGLAAAKGADVA
ncbi:MAG TPA: lysophospholipid acyltransferase family protein [Vicinamibacteria bacterium]|nr:lysophospholipid acyltransferase family protein [Vicinamibacteria bacterium]